MRIALTGATGFLGSHLLKALLENNHEAVIIKRSFSDLSRIERLINECEAFNCDISPVKNIFKNNHIDAVIHCATVCRPESASPSYESIKGNVLFPAELMEAAAAAGCGYFINTDTFFCKQLPERLEKNIPLYMPEYTISKYQFGEWGRLFAAEDKINFINLRMEHIYGENDNPKKFVPWLIRELENNTPEIKLTEGIQLRDFVHVEDAAQVYLKILSSLKDFSGFNSFEIGTGKTTSVRSFAEKLKSEFNSSSILGFGKIPTKENEIMYSCASKDSLFLVPERKRYFMR